MSKRTRFGPTLTPEQREEMQAVTREAAAALIEDLAYIRQLFTLDQPPRGELRRLSAVLRRIVVDGSGDLGYIAAARIGRIRLSIPDNKPLMVVLRKEAVEFFCSGGVKLFGMTRYCIYKLRREHPPALTGFDVTRTIDLPVDTFLSQNVLCLDGNWISRRDVIKYMANIASGVHTKPATEPIHKILAKLRIGFVYEAGFGLRVYETRLRAAESAFAYNPDGLDVVLIELLAAARYLVDSPDVIRLEAMIRQELVG